jgi:hypothetical protein
MNSALDKDDGDKPENGVSYIPQFEEPLWKRGSEFSLCVGY